MPLPDGYLPRKGDVLTLLVTVQYDTMPDDSYVHVVPNGRLGSLGIELEHFDGLRSRAWEVGDHVRSENEGASGVVEAVSGHWVWFKVDADHVDMPGAMLTADANELELIPEPAAPEASAAEPPRAAND